MSSIRCLVLEQAHTGGIERLSPTAHLKVLRAAGNTKSEKLPILETGLYLSPFLHNVSDTWVRHLRKKALRCAKDPYPERRPYNESKIDRATAHRLRSWTESIRQHSREFMETTADNELEKAIGYELQTRSEKVDKIMKKNLAIDREGQTGEGFGWRPVHWFDIRLQIHEEQQAEKRAAALASKSKFSSTKFYEFTLCDDNDNEFSSHKPKPIREYSILSCNWDKTNSGFFKSRVNSYWRSFTSKSSNNSDNKSVFSKGSSARTDMGSVDDISDDKSSRADKPALERKKLPEPWMKYGPTIGQARRNKFLSDLRSAREEVLPVDYGWQRPPMHDKRCEELKRNSSPGLCYSTFVISLFVEMAEQGLTTSNPMKCHVYSTPASTVQGASTVILSESMQKRLKNIGIRHHTLERSHEFMKSIVNRIQKEIEYIALRKLPPPIYEPESKDEYTIDSMVRVIEDCKSSKMARKCYEQHGKSVRNQVLQRQEDMYRCFDKCKIAMSEMYVLNKAQYGLR